MPRPKADTAAAQRSCRAGAKGSHRCGSGRAGRDAEGQAPRADVVGVAYTLESPSRSRSCPCRPRPREARSAEDEVPRGRGEAASAGRSASLSRVRGREDREAGSGAWTMQRLRTVSREGHSAGQGRGGPKVPAPLRHRTAAEPVRGVCIGAAAAGGRGVCRGASTMADVDGVRHDRRGPSRARSRPRCPSKTALGRGSVRIDRAHRHSPRARRVAAREAHNYHE